MTEPARRTSRWDKVLIGIVAALAVASIVPSERECRGLLRWKAQQPAIMSIQPPSIWPARVLDGKRPAERTLRVVRPGLVAASLGLAFVAFRPGRAARPRRRGPGHVAVAIAAALSVVSAVMVIWWLWGYPLLTGRDYFPPGSPTLPFLAIAAVGPKIAWAIGAAWIYLVSTGQWRRPLDPLDRPGRWLGRAWIGIAAAGWAVDMIPGA